MHDPSHDDPTMPGELRHKVHHLPRGHRVQPRATRRTRRSRANRQERSAYDEGRAGEALSALLCLRRLAAQPGARLRAHRAH